MYFIPVTAAYLLLANAMTPLEIHRRQCRCNWKSLSFFDTLGSHSILSASGPQLYKANFTLI